MYNPDEDRAIGPYRMDLGSFTPVMWDEERQGIVVDSGWARQVAISKAMLMTSRLFQRLDGEPPRWRVEALNGTAVYEEEYLTPDLSKRHPEYVYLVLAEASWKNVL